MKTTQMSTERLVCNRHTETGDNELSIVSILGKLRKDPRDYAAPVFETLQDEDDLDMSFMATPLLRSMNIPPFETIGEVVESVDQVLEVYCPVNYRQSYLTVFGDVFTPNKAWPIDISSRSHP